MRTVALALVLGGCAHLRTVPADVAYVRAPSWHTMTSQQRVQVLVHVGDHDETKALRGLLAVERPDKFRLRALGPAGLTLFDLLVRHGEVKVISAIRHSAALDDVIGSLAADLETAYALEPDPGRTIEQAGDAVVVHAGERTVRLSQFAGSPPTWRKAEIETPRYRVTVSVEDVSVDPTLDPAMFTD